MTANKKMIDAALKAWCEYKPDYKKACTKHPNDSEYGIMSCIGCRMEQAINAALKEGKS